jgi:hypothetical protein
VAQILLHPVLSTVPLVIVDVCLVLMMVSGRGLAVETMLILALCAGLIAALLALVVSLRDIGHVRAQESAA